MQDQSLFLGGRSFFCRRRPFLCFRSFLLGEFCQVLRLLQGIVVDLLVLAQLTVEPRKPVLGNLKPLQVFLLLRSFRPFTSFGYRFPVRQSQLRKSWQTAAGQRQGQNSGSYGSPNSLHSHSRLSEAPLRTSSFP